MRYVNLNYPVLKEKRSFLGTLFFMITAFVIIKYVNKTKYMPEIGALVTKVKNEKQYRELLDYFSGQWKFPTKHTYLAIAIKCFSPRIAYNMIRCYYRFATRNKKIE